jgi:hypothetical protein
MIQSAQFIRRAAAVTQVTALLFLQIYAALPAFGHFVAPGRAGAVCRGDHRLCGCPLERIANRTCCCFKSSEMAASGMEHHKMESLPVSEIAPLARFVCPPCGAQPNFIFTSLEKIKFLRFAATPEGPDFLVGFNLSLFWNRFQSRSNEPPDPPPKSIAS